MNFALLATTVCRGYGFILPSCRTKNPATGPRREGGSTRSPSARLFGNESLRMWDPLAKPFSPRLPPAFSSWHLRVDADLIFLVDPEGLFWSQIPFSLTQIVWIKATFLPPATFFVGIISSCFFATRYLLFAKVNK